MQINPFGSGFGGVSLNPAGGTAPQSSGTIGGGIDTERPDLLSARRKLFRILEALDEVQRVMSGGSTILSGLATARSDPALDLDLSATAAALRSVDQVNATPTSFSPFVPQWGGDSTAFLTFGGVYDGTHGSGPLSFEVRRGGDHGVDRLRIRVRDPDNNVIRNVTIRENHLIDRQYSLNNGLYFTLSPGSLDRFDTTTMQVFEDVGSVVDPDKPFNGAGNDNPNFEFGLPEIVAGSFKVNGETIAVGANDTLNDVLAAINQSAAGVTAVFNPATERIEMSHNTLGSAGVIDIEAGDSNFVATTKLLDAVLQPGLDPDTLRPLDTVAQFAGVQSGDIMVNGERIAIDAGNDSLDDIIARINSSGAGAVASFDPQTQRVEITGQDESESLVIDGNGTGLFGALNIPQGRVDPAGRGRGYAQRKAQHIVQAMDDAMTALNEFFQDSQNSGRVNDKISAFRGQLRNAFADVIGADNSPVDTGIGLTINFDAVGKEYSRFATLDNSDFSRRLRTSGNDVNRFLNGTDDTTGLIQSVAMAAQRAFQSLNATLGTRGTLFDAYA